MSRHARTFAAAAAITLAVSGATATAAGGPTPLAPSNGKSLTAGKAFTFKVRSSAEGGVFLKVSKSKKKGKDGTLAAKDDLYFRKMGKKGSTFSKKTETYDALPDYFLNKPGRYYWQAYRIDCAAQSDCNVEGAIRSFRNVATRRIDRKGRGTVVLPRPTDPADPVAIYRVRARVNNQLSFTLQVAVERA